MVNHKTAIWCVEIFLFTYFLSTVVDAVLASTQKCFKKAYCEKNLNKQKTRV